MVVRDTCSIRSHTILRVATLAAPHLIVSFAIAAHQHAALATDKTIEVAPTLVIEGDGQVSLTTVSGDGRVLFSSGFDESTVFRDASDGRVIRRREEGVPLWGIVQSPDQTALCVVALAGGGPVKVIRCTDGGTSRILTWPGFTMPRCAQFSPGGDLIAVSIEALHEENETEKDVKLVLWNHKSDKKTEWPRMHNRRINSIAFAPNGKRIATASEDHKVCEWSVPDGRLVAEYAGHSASVWSVVYSPDGKRIVTGGADSRILFWDVESKQKLGELHDHTGTVASTAFILDGQRLVSCDGTGLIVFSDAISFETIAKLRTGQERVIRIAFSTNGELMASSDSRGGVRLWDVSAVLSDLEKRNE